MMMLLPQTVPEISPLWGYLVPAFVFLFSFWATWMLYRHFTKQLEE